MMTISYADGTETVPTNRRSSLCDLLLLPPSGVSWVRIGARVIRALARTIRLRYQFFVTGYVAMPEHVHLLVTEPESSPLATALQAFFYLVHAEVREKLR